ncbi:MAG TPA: flotillin family protein [Chroococcales cyanobacterium]
MDPLAAFFIGCVAVICLLVVWIRLKFYHKCGPHEAMIITSSVLGSAERMSNFKIVLSGGSIVLPKLQKLFVLSLDVMTVELSKDPIITANHVPIAIECCAQVRINSDEISITQAVEHFLDKSDREIVAWVHERLLVQLDAVISTVTVEELLESFDSAAQRLQRAGAEDLAPFGMTVVSLTIKNIRDNVGYLKGIAKRQIAEAKGIAGT